MRITATFGDSPRVRILDHIIYTKDKKFTTEDIIRATKISRTSAFKDIPKLVEKGILVHAKSVGPAKYLVLNKKNKEVKRLIEFCDILKEANK